MSSKKAEQFTESVIREMTRLCERHGALNLSQGFPDFKPDSLITEPAIEAIRNGYNQYSYTWGLGEFRTTLCEIIERDKGVSFNPEEEIVITCGDSEAVIASLMATVNPEEHVIIFEPHYENYIPGCIMAGAEPVYVPIEDNEIDFDRLEEAFSNTQPAAIIVNTPHNPSGKVFTRNDFEKIAPLCEKYDTTLITDETYEYILYDDREHLSPAALNSLKDRTVMTSSFGKTFGVTGWRVGYAAASENLIKGIRKMHDYLTICSPTPFQKAISDILSKADEYFTELRRSYEEKRELMVEGLRKAGFKLSKPQGSYYIMADYSDLSDMEDRPFAEKLIKEAGVGTVPGTSFYSGRYRHKGKHRIRFSFPRKKETIRNAMERLNDYFN